MVKKFIRGFLVSVALLMVVFVLDYGLSLIIEHNELLGMVTLVLVSSVIGGALYAKLDF